MPSLTVPAWKLKLLDYPRVEEFSLSDNEEVATFVSFLEDRHIRALDIENRAPLRRYSPDWYTAFGNYLQEIRCPFVQEDTGSSFDPERKLEYITWLVGHAIALDYEEKGVTYNQDAATYMNEHPSGTVVSSSAASSSSSSSVSSSTGNGVPPETMKLLHELATLLRVPIDKKSPSELLQAIHRVLRMWILPAATEREDTLNPPSRSNTKTTTTTTTSPKATTTLSSSSATSSSSSTATKGTLDVKEFSAGFTTGNETLDKAATILRMLYIADIRELQDAVNDIIVTVQDYVADPRTDASLGMVGR